MNSIITSISLLGGLAMFLYGMEIMGDGLKNSSGDALKNFLGKLTQNVFLGLITGTVVTAIIQSSTATIVLTVGLIGAGILNLRQAVSIVLGANIGTTITAQIIRLMDLDTSGNSFLLFLKPDTLAPIALIIGIILLLFIKKGNSKNIGMIFLGFGILFTGLMSMTNAVAPLAESEAFVNILAYFTNIPVLGIFTGLILTVIVQSSSAMVGILQALSTTGMITFDLVYPIIMGINLGTCVTTALVCSIGSSKDAKRTGIVHIVFNSIGTIIFMIAMSLLRHSGLFTELWNSVADSGVIANFQTLFNLITAVLLLPFTGLLVKLSCKIVKEDSIEENKFPELAALDTKLLISPAVALGEATRALTIISNIAKENVNLSLKQFDKYDSNRTEQINQMEERIDKFTDRVESYLIELSQKLETDRGKAHLNTVLQSAPNIERIGDYATNFDELAVKMHEEKLIFSETGKKEFKIICDAVEEILRLTVEALETDSESIARRIEPLEEVIDDMVLILKNRHTERLCRGICSVNSGIVFMEFLTNLERAADQCSNIAMLIIGENNEVIMKNHHQYLEELHNSDDKSYIAEQKNRKAQYLDALEKISY